MIRRLLQTEPALLVTFVVAFLGLLVALGVITEEISESLEKVLTAAVPLVTVVAGFALRQVVSSPATVATVAVRAATETATELAGETVGAVGQVTDAGVGVVGHVAENVAGAVGGLAGGLARRTLGQ